LVVLVVFICFLIGVYLMYKRQDKVRRA